MSIKRSKYVRQGKKTFNFISMSGGAYGCNILYEYGYFNGAALHGMRFGYESYTEFESDPDEKDGIGSMRTVRKRRLLVGDMLDGKPHGLCSELVNGTVKVGYYENGELLRPAEDVEADGEFCFSDYETMPVDPVTEEGFSVLREMDYFSDGGLRYTVTEGMFRDGRLNGLGTVYYDSNVNGYHCYTEASGLFKDGELVFGYRNRYENSGGKKRPASFGYADGRDTTDLGEGAVCGGRGGTGEARDKAPFGVDSFLFPDGRLIRATVRDGKPHGIGATYKKIEGEWLPYDFINDRVDRDLCGKSFGIFAEGEYMPDITWEEFFEKYEGAKKV